MIPPFQLYLFDVDGVLLDSAPDICAAVHKVLREEHQLDLDYELLKSYIGKHLFELFHDYLPLLTAAQAQQLLDRYRETYHGRGHRATKVYPGVRETLERLPGRKATATTKSTETAEKLLTMFCLRDCFDRVQGTDGFPAKPNPDVLLKTIHALAIPPEQCLFVGDAEADMIAGRRAGVKVCAATYGYGAREKLARHQPDYWIADIRELLPEAAVPR